ncbi:MAG: NTP transferase domain-containing protein [Clostridia bacterium]|nr:NTP transferase domain-containing protein [Clostridia bacterium]
MKAVVLAGGKGTRLRPMTCDTPKPLATVCGKPILEYIFDLLIRSGVREACVTLGYLSQCIEQRYPDGVYGPLRLAFSDEPSALGTAGSDKKAAGDWTEPFIVVSGDAMCDFELDKIAEYHRSVGADVTVAAYRVDDPREFGLIEKDGDGRIRRFLEKPSWGQATTDLANTGIYILDPSCLNEIPDDTPYDFAQQLFPQMLRKDRAMYCYQAEGYWCDVGDVPAYLRCQRDLLQGKIRFPLKKAQDGVYVQDIMPVGDYTIVPPVYIGSRAQIGNGAVIGPYTVLESGVTVGAKARVRGSVLHSRAQAGFGASMQDAVLCCGARLLERASMFERSVAGSDSVIGARASVRQNVRIWPEKSVDSGTVVREDVRFGVKHPDYFGGNGVDENVELTSQMCVSLGSAVGSIPACRKTGVGHDGSSFAKALTRALEAGILSAGGHVWSFGECFEAQLSYATAFCGLSIGIFIRGGERPQIRICGDGGLPAPRYLEREIETRMRQGEYNRCLPQSVRDVADMRSILLMYGRELMKQAPMGLSGTEVCVQCADPQISLLMEDILLRLGYLRSRSLIFRISSDGFRAQAVTENQTVPHEKLLAVCCADAFREGLDVALAYDAPLALDTLAAQYGRTVHRYLSAPTDDSDAAARRLSAKQIFLRDGLYLCVRVLRIIKQRNMTLDALCEEIPDFYLERKTFSVSFSPSKLHDLFGAGQDADASVREGISLKRDKGRLLITPDRNGKSLHVLAEAANMETAAEMCSGFERLLSELEQQQGE